MNQDRDIYSEFYIQGSLNSSLQWERENEDLGFVLRADPRVWWWRGYQSSLMWSNN